MEIIDAFCGIGPWQRRDRLLPYKSEEILELMDHFGIARALVHSNFTVGKGPAVRGNRLLKEACGKHDRFWPAFSIWRHPYDDLPDVDAYIAEMRRAGSKAVYLASASSMSSPWLCEDIFAPCSRMKLPVFMDRAQADPSLVHRVCGDFPDLRVILTGVSYGEDTWLYPLLKKHENLHVCTGHYYIPSGGPMRFLKHFPAERLLFGSGLPHFSPGGIIAHVMYADISDADRQKILSGNIKRLLAEVAL